jgi:hypothetical protein
LGSAGSSAADGVPGRSGAVVSLGTAFLWCIVLWLAFVVGLGKLIGVL